MNIRTFVTILSRKAQCNFPKMRGGSKAVWNFSENSSDLLTWPVPYCAPFQYCQSSGSLIPHKTWFQMSNTPNIQLPWLTNLIQILCHWALQGSRKWYWWSKWSRFGTAGVQEIPICGVYNALNISGNHPWCFFWYLGPIFWLLAFWWYFTSSKNLLQDSKRAKFAQSIPHWGPLGVPKWANKNRLLSSAQCR